MTKPNPHSENGTVCTGNDVPQNSINVECGNSNVPQVIVSEADFLFSFSEHSKRQTKNYSKAVEFHKKINNRSEVARLIKHPNRTVQDWLSGKGLPPAINAINELKRNELLPLKIDENSEVFMLFVEIFAFVYGDGSLKKDLFGIDFTGQEIDLIALKKRIDSLFTFESTIVPVVSSSIIRKQINGKIQERLVSGTAYCLRLRSAQLAKLLYLAGATKGDKVAQQTTIPNWLMNAPKEVKRRFLSVLFANELACPQIRAKNAFTSPNLGFHKIESKEDDLRVFLEQIRQLLREFDISTSPVAVDNSYKCLRKDDTFSKKLYFSIDSHSPNIIRLFKEIPFLYCDEKQQKFAKAVEQFLQNSRHLKTEWELYDKVIQMHDSGLGRRTIFRKLGLPNTYFYKINAWIHYGNKPLYYDERNLLNGLNQPPFNIDLIK